MSLCGWRASPSGSWRSAGRFCGLVAALLLLWCAPARAQDGSLFGKGALSGPAEADKPAKPDADASADSDDATVPSIVRVAKVTMGGIERLDARTVQEQIRCRAGQLLDPGVIADDVRRLFAMGLFDDVRVGISQLGRPKDAEDPEDAVFVEIRYQFLERPSIAELEIRGNDEQSDEDLKKIIDLRINHLYNAQDAAANVQKLRDHYADEGFFLATVSHHTEPLPDNQVRVVFDVVERAEVKVRQIDILGNTGVPDADIKAVLRTQEGSIFSLLGKSGNFKPETLDYDMQVIQYLYLTKGYIQAKVEDPVVTLSADMKYITVAIHVTEGPQFRVGKVQITGDPVQKPEELQDKLTLKSGDIFNYANVQADGQKLSGAQKNFGYANATVSNESVPDADKRTVDWTFHVQRGKKVYFGQIVMQGGGNTRDKVIRREMVINEGELYSEDKIQISQARIQRLGFFESVSVKTRATALPQVVDVVVEVKERTTGQFQVGMGFSSLDSFIGTAQIAKDNFLGRGQRMSVQGQISRIRQMFQGSFWEPYFLDTNVTFSIDLYRFDQLFSDFSRTSTGGSMSWGYRLTDTLLVDVGYTGELVKSRIGGLNGRTDVPIASLFGGGFTSSIRASMTFDSRNDRMFPSKGWFATGSAEWATSYLGSENLFTRFRGNIRRYFPMPLDGVLKFNLVGGIIQAPEGRTVPLFERFFLGGIFNVRGFNRNTLGPLIAIPASGDPGSSLAGFNVGGTRQLYLNNELEVPIVKAPMNLRGLVFFDIGNAFGEGEPVSLAGMRMAWGWGVRWFSPVGPLRFEWGIPINPRKNEQVPVFEFTIGNSF